MKLTKSTIKKLIKEELNEANLQGLISNLEGELYRSFKRGDSLGRIIKFLIAGGSGRVPGDPGALELVRSVAGRVRNNDGDPAFLQWLIDLIYELEEFGAS